MFKRLIVILPLLLLPSIAHAEVVAAVLAYEIIGMAVSSWLVVISVAMSVAMSIKANNTATGSQSQSQQKQTLKVARPPKQVIYGKGLFAGALIFAEEQIGDDENDDGTYNEWLHTAQGFCNHEVESVDELYFNERPMSDFSGYESHTIHNNSNVVDSNLVWTYHPPVGVLNVTPAYYTGTPSWQADMIGFGTLWIKMSMRFDREKYANGMPTLLALIKGKKIYDPRTDTTVYSNNAALVIYDYFVNHMNVSPDRLITAGFGSFIDAANLCDEIVNGERRYTINGRFNLSEKPTEILGSLLASCGGQLVRTAGSIGLLPAAYYGGVSDITLSSSDIIGDINIQPEPSYKDSVNTIKGTFVDPDQDYVEAEYPPLTDQTMIDRVGTEISSDVNYLFVTNADQAQRLSSIQLRRAVAGGGVELQTNLKGLYCHVGMVVNLEIPELSLIGEFRVSKSSNHIAEGVTLTMSNESPDIYDDAIGIPFVSPPLTNLPVSGVREPANVTFTVQQLGEVVQGMLRWEIRQPQSASTDIRVTRTTDNVVVYNTNTTGREIPLNGLPAGSYLMEVRTVSTSGATSIWVSNTIIIGAPSTPTSVELKQSNWNIQLVPNVDGEIPEGTIFEFKYLADTESYLTGNPTYGEGDINNAETKTVFSGSSFNHGGLTPDRYHHYWVRSVNTYAVSEWVYVKTWTLREQDLVTTVIERLESIEIVSSNYLEGENGYKINVDGAAEFNDITARGHIEAESGDIKSILTIGGDNQNFLDGSTSEYAAWFGGGNATIKKNGDVYFANGEFGGTVYADKIIGDVVSSASFPANTGTIGTSWSTISTLKVRNNTRGVAQVVIRCPSFKFTLENNKLLIGSAYIRILHDGVTVASDVFTAKMAERSFTDESSSIPLVVTLGECNITLDETNIDVNTFVIQAYQTVLGDGSVELSCLSSSVTGQIFRKGSAWDIV